MRKEKSVKTPNRFRAIAVILQLSMFINLLPAQSIGSSRDQGKVRLEHFLEKASYARNEEEWMRIAEEGMLSALGGWEGKEREEIENDTEYLSAKEDYEKETEKAYIEWKAKRYAEERDALERSVVRKILNESAAEWNYLDSDGNQTRMIEESQVKDARSQWYEYAEGLVDEYLETTDYTSQIMLGIKDYTSKLSEDEKKEIISKANSSYKQIKRNEYRDVLEIESNDLMRYMLYDQYSLRKKTDAEAAAIIATGLANETNVLTTQNMNNVFSQIDTIVEMNEDEIQTAEEQWLSNFSRVMEDSLAKWDEAEREFLVKRSEWEKDAVETYVNDEEVWQKAMDTLKQKRNEWNKDILDKLEKGRSKWARQKNDTKNELDKVLAEYESTLQNEKNIKEKVLDVEVSTYEKSRDILSMNFQGINGWYTHWTERYNGLYAYWKTEESNNKSDSTTNAHAHTKALKDFSTEPEITENNFEKKSYITTNEEINQLINMINGWKEEYIEAVINELNKSIDKINNIITSLKRKIANLNSAIENDENALNASDNRESYSEKQNRRNRLSANKEKLSNLITELSFKQEAINSISDYIAKLTTFKNSKIIKISKISEYTETVRNQIIAEQKDLQTIIKQLKQKYCKIDENKTEEENKLFFINSDNKLFDYEDMVYDAEDSLYGWLSNHIQYVDNCKKAVINIFQYAGTLSLIDNKGDSSDEAEKKALELKLTGNNPTFSLDELQTELVKAQAVQHYWLERKNILEECMEYIRNETSTSDTLEETAKKLEDAKEAYKQVCDAYDAQVMILEDLGELVDSTREALAEAQDDINKKYTILETARDAYNKQQTTYNGVSNDTLKARIESIISKLNAIYADSEFETGARKSDLHDYYMAVQELYNTERTKKKLELKTTLTDGKPDKNIEGLESLKNKTFNADQILQCQVSDLDSILNSISIYNQKEKALIKTAWTRYQENETSSNEKKLLEEMIRQAVEQLNISNEKEIQKREIALKYIDNEYVEVEELPTEDEIKDIKTLNLLKAAEYALEKGIESGVEEAVSYEDLLNELKAIMNPEPSEEGNQEKALRERIIDSDYKDYIDYILCGAAIFENDNLNQLINYKYESLMWGSKEETSKSHKIVLSEITNDVKAEYAQYNNDYMNSQADKVRAQVAELIEKHEAIDSRQALLEYVIKLYKTGEELSETGYDVLEKYIAEFIKQYVVSKIKSYDFSGEATEQVFEFPLTVVEFQEKNETYSKQQKELQNKMNTISQWGQVSDLEKIVEVIKSKEYQTVKNGNLDLDKAFVDYGTAYLFVEIIKDDYLHDMLIKDKGDNISENILHRFGCEQETEENKELRNYLLTIIAGAIGIYRNSYKDYSGRQNEFLKAYLGNSFEDNEDLSKLAAEEDLKESLLEINNTEIENLSELYLKYNYEHENTVLFEKFKDRIFDDLQLTWLEKEFGNLNELFVIKITKGLEALSETEIPDYEALYRAAIYELVEDYNTKISEDNETIKSENEKLNAEHQIPLKNAIEISYDFVLYDKKKLDTFEYEEKKRRMEKYLAEENIDDYDLAQLEKEWYIFYRTGSDALYVYLSLDDRNLKLIDEVVSYAESKTAPDSEPDANIRKLRDYLDTKRIINSYSPYYDGDVKEWLLANNINETNPKYDIIFEALNYGTEYLTESHYQQQIADLVNVVGDYAASSKIIRKIDEGHTEVQNCINDILTSMQNNLFTLNINRMIDNTAVSHADENTSYREGIIAEVNKTNKANGVTGVFQINEINEGVDFTSVYSSYFTQKGLLPAITDAANADANITELRSKVRDKEEALEKKDQMRQSYLTQVKNEFDVLLENQKGMGDVLAKLRDCQKEVDKAKQAYDDAVTASGTAFENYKTAVNDYTAQLTLVNKAYEKMEEGRLHYRSADEIYQWAENTYLRTETESHVVGDLNDNKVPVTYQTPQEKLKLVEQSYVAATISVEVLTELQNELKNEGKDTVEKFTENYSEEYKLYRKAEKDYYISRVLHAELSSIVGAQRDKVNNLELEEDGIISNILNIKDYNPYMHETPFEMKGEIMKLISIQRELVDNSEGLNEDQKYKYTVSLNYTIETLTETVTSGETISEIKRDFIKKLNAPSGNTDIFDEYLNSALGEDKYDAYDDLYWDRKSQEEAMAWLHDIGNNNEKLTKVVLAALYLERLCIDNKPPIIQEKSGKENLLGAFGNVFDSEITNVRGLQKLHNTDYPSVMSGAIEGILRENWQYIVKNGLQDDVAKYLLYKDTYLSGSMSLEQRALDHLRIEAIKSAERRAENEKTNFLILGGVATATAAAFYAMVTPFSLWALVPAIAATVVAAYEFIKARDVSDLISTILEPTEREMNNVYSGKCSKVTDTIKKWDEVESRKKSNIKTLNLMLYGVENDKLTGGKNAAQLTYATLHTALSTSLSLSKVLSISEIDALVTEGNFNEIFNEDCTSSEQAVVMIEDYYRTRAQEARAELEKKVYKNEKDNDEAAALSEKSLKQQQVINSAGYYELLDKYLNNEIEFFDDNDTSLTEEQKKQARSKLKEELKKKAKAAWGDGTFRSNVYNSNIINTFVDETDPEKKLDKGKVRYDRKIESYISDEINNSGVIDSFKKAYKAALQSEIELKLDLKKKENDLIWNDLLTQINDWQIQMSYILSVADSEWLKSEKRLTNEWNNWRSNYAEEYEKKLNEWNENYTQFQEEKRNWIMSAYMNASEGKWNELTAGYDIEREKIVKNVMEKSGLIGRMKDAVTALSEDTDAYVESLTNSGILKNIMNYASDMSDRADYGIKRAKRGNAISTQADEWLKNALDKADQTNTEYEKTAQKLSEQKAQEQLRETIDGYMAQIDAQNKGIRDWEIETVRSSGYSVNGRSIKRTAIIDSTLMNNVKKTQTVEMYEDFKTVRPETDISSSEGQNAQNAMEKIILAMDSVKKWAVKIFGRKDFDENGDAVTRERFIKRKTGTKSADSLIASYEENARTLDTEQTELENSGKIKELEDLEKKIKDNGWDKLSKDDQDKYSKLSGEIVRLSDGALNEWIGYAPVLSDNPDFKKSKEENIKYQGYGQMGIIMLDIQWNAMEEGNGLAELAKPMYDKKMWDDDGAWIQPPTFRAVADIVLDIVGNVTGQKWIGYLDDALFATLDLTGGYKTPAEVGLELGKKALTSAVSWGASSIGSAASAAASAAITNTAANVAAQAGISMVQSYATSVATSAINSVNLVNGELKFDGEGFGKSLYSASTIGGALGAGVTAGLNEYSLGARTVDGLDADGNAIKTIEYTRAQGLNSTQIDNMGKFNSLMGGLSSSAVSFAIDGKATFNILNASDLGIKSNTGLFELTVGKDGISSTIGSGGTNISMGNLMASLNGAKATVKNTQINNAVNKKYEGNMNVANMLRAQYGFGDNVQLDQLDSILKGNTELVFGNTTDGKAQTVDENGKRIVHMNMDKNGDWKMGAIMLGHESYRDGIVGSADAQLEETRRAVKGHTEMTVKMMNDKLYMASMMDLIGSNQNLQNDLIVSLFSSEDSFNSYVDNNYDSSADYWLIHNDGSITWDGNLNLYVEKDIYDENGNVITHKKDILYDKNGKGVIRKTESPDEAVNYRQLQALIDSTDGDTVNISGIDVKVDRLKEIQEYNNLIVRNGFNIFGNYNSYAAEALLSDGYMSYDDALKSEQDLLTRYLTGYGSTNLIEHWSARYVLNKNDEFAKTDWENSDFVPAANQDVETFRRKVKEGDIIFPENVELLGDGASVYHGKDCLKYLVKNNDFMGSSRELVLGFNSENGTYGLETRDAYLGTYNFGNGPLKKYHTDLDVLPYWSWGNTPDDLYGSKAQGIQATPFLKRVHPNIQKAIDTHNKLLLENKEYASYWYLRNSMNYIMY